MSSCNPLAIDSKKCFNESDLKIFILIYNKTKLNGKIKENSKNKYNSINNNLKNILGDKNHYLWFDYLCQYCSFEDCKILNNITDKRLLPRKPASWYKNKTAWLSNIDIDNVLKNYNNTKKYKYEFIGTFTVDFGLKNKDGSCKYYENKCIANIERSIKNEKKYLGIITNMDKYNQGGSHWTSIFMIIDPNVLGYGIYYYDSVGNGVPSMIKKYLNDVKCQLKKLYSNRECKIFVNKKRYQFSSTECGMFAITYQLSWILKLFTNKNACENDILKDNIMTDNNMIINRDKLFAAR